MKLDIKYINTHAVTKKICNITFQPESVCPAHEIEKPGFKPYVNLAHLELLAVAIRKDDLDIAKKMLNELGL